MLLLPLDLETTGLDPKRDRILEVAWTTIRPDLSEALLQLRSFVVTAEHDEFALLHQNPYVLNMHKSTGLYDDLLKDNSLRLEDIEDHILADIMAGTADDSPVHLFGASVDFDARFIETYMPRLHTRLHHRVFNTSTLKMFFDTIDGIEHDVVNQLQHRAASDVEEVIAVARSYREAVQWFVARAAN